LIKGVEKEHMGFLEQLDTHYRQEGYQTYSKHLPLMEASPEGWRGPLPDLLARKDQKVVAVFLETLRSLEDPLTPKRLTQARENPGTTLRLFVHSQAELALLRNILESEGVPAEVALIEKKLQRVRHPWPRGKQLVRRALILLLVVIVCYFILWLATLLYDYSPQFYEPRDFERESGVSLLRLF